MACDTIKLRIFIRAWIILSAFYAISTKVMLKDLLVLFKRNTLIVLVTRYVERVEYFIIIAFWIPRFPSVLEEALTCLLVEYMLEPVVIRQPVAVMLAVVVPKVVVGWAEVSYIDLSCSGKTK